MSYLKEKHGIILLGKTPEGTCPMCAVAHDKEMPHNRDSLVYDNALYNDALSGWRKDQTMSQTTSSKMAVETIWMNYEPPAEQMEVDFG